MDRLSELSVRRYLDDVLKENAQLVVSGADLGKAKDASVTSKAWVESRNDLDVVGVCVSMSDSDKTVLTIPSGLQNPRVYFQNVGLCSPSWRIADKT
jgi:hypothetical protein